MTRIILVRHCEAEGNTKGVLQGRTDNDISGNGAQQLDLVALRLRNEPIRAVYSSPLKRALKTAQAINRWHELSIHTDPRLIEIDMGDWEGLSWDEIEREYPKEARAWMQAPAQFAAPHGESMRSVADRMWEAVREIARENPDSLVLVTSHGCAIRNFLCCAEGRPLEELNQLGWSDNTGVSIVDFDDELNSEVVLMNDASHIPAELSAYRSRNAASLDPEVKKAAP